LVINGGFEDGTNPWQESSSQNFSLICTRETCGDGLPQPHSGSALAWLGGGNNERSRLSQTLTIPAGQPAQLSFQYWIDSEDYCGYDYGYVQLFVNNQSRSVQRYSLCNNTHTSGWAAQALDLSSYAGQTVRLDFYVATDRSLLSSLLIDDVSLRSGSSCTEGTAAGMVPSAVDMPLDELFSEPPEIIRGEEPPAGDAKWRR
jgi:immune inhibitor A